MYTQEISRLHRTAFVIAIDLSGSMASLIEIGEMQQTKAKWVCNTANRLLFELIERARRSDGVHNYYDIAVVGYSGQGVRPLLDPEQWFIGVDRLAELPHEQGVCYQRRIAPDGLPIMLEMRYPVWIKPQAEGLTPMYEALCEVYGHLKGWLSDPRHRESFPPVVFNITDGESSDCDQEALLDIASQIRSLRTNDGEVLLINIHISSNTLIGSCSFPSSREELGENRYAKMLYDASSVMPTCFEPLICEMKQHYTSGPFRGMSYNCSIHELALMLNIGSISIPIR